MRNSILIFSLVATLTGFTQQMETVLQTGHTETMLVMDFHPTKPLLATGGKDHRVIVWETNTGKQRFVFDNFKDEIEAIAFSPNGKYLAIGDEAKQLHVYDVEKGTVLRSGDIGWYAMEIEFTKDGKYMLVDDGDILVFRTSDWKLVRRLKWDGSQRTFLRAIETSPNGKTLYAFFEDGPIRVYDLTTLTKKKDFKHTKNYWGRSMRISSNGKYLYLKERSAGLTALDANTGMKIDSLSAPEGPEWDDLTGDGSCIITVGSAGPYEYDGKTGKRIRLYRAKGVRINSGVVRLSPDGKFFAVASERGDRSITLWSRETGKLIREMGGIVDDVSTLRFHPNKPILSIGGMNRTLIDLSKASSVSGYKPSSKHSYTSPVFSKDGKMMACYRRGKLCVSEYDTKKDLFEVESSSFKHMTFSPDGKHIVIGESRGHLTIIDVDSGKVKHKIFTHKDDWYWKIAFIDNDQFLAAGGNDLLAVWSCSKGQIVRKTKLEQDRYFATSLEKGLIAAAYGYDLRFYDFDFNLIKHIPLKFNEGFNDVEFSPDGKSLGIALDEGHVVHCEVGTWKTLGSIRPHSDRTNTVTFSNNSKLMFTGGDDGKVIIWETGTMKQLGTIVTISDYDFVISMNDGYYAAEKGALNMVAFRKGATIYPFKQFDLKYNRPDLVVERLGYANPILVKMYKKAYEKRLRKLGFTEDMLNEDFHLPQARILNKDIIDIGTTEQQFEFKVKGWDEKYPLSHLLLYVNGVKTAKIQTKGKANVEKHVSILLSRGTNVIEVVAMNDKGVRSRADVMTINYTPKIESKPDLHLILIGVSKFTDQNFNLDYASKDAGDIATFYQESRRKNFANVHVHQLMNEKANRNGIEKMLSEAVAQAGVDDQIIVFYSSHGVLDENLNYFLATTDMDFAKPELKGMPYEQLESIIANSPCRNRLLLIDACHSGEVDKEELDLKESLADNISAKHKGTKGLIPRTGLNNAFSYMQTLFTDISGEAGVTVLSASGGYQFAYESPKWNNGVFTYALLNALKSREIDVNRDYRIQISELSESVKHQVYTLTRGKQLPTTRSLNLVNDFVIY